MSETLSISEAAALLPGRKRILILTHERPDGDALGSSFGMREFLRQSCGSEAEVVLPAPPPSRYRELIGEYRSTLGKEELSRCDLILLLDCANRERIACPPAFDPVSLPELAQVPMLNVDHHENNTVRARWNLVVPQAAAASELAAQIALAADLPIPKAAATLWLLGIVTDTGSFRFPNTHGGTLRTASELLDRGADLPGVMNAVYCSKPLNQQRFEAELVATQEKLAFGGRCIYAYIPDELLAKYDFDMRDGEGVIDLLREVAGTKVAMLCYRKGDSFKVSLRSKDFRCPVGPLARSLGGGGHEMAAGITLRGMDHAQVEALLLEKIGALLGESEQD